MLGASRLLPVDLGFVFDKNTRRSKRISFSIPLFTRGLKRIDDFRSHCILTNGAGEWILHIKRRFNGFCPRRFLRVRFEFDLRRWSYLNSIVANRFFMFVRQREKHASKKLIDRHRKTLIQLFFCDGFDIALISKS